MSSYACSCHKTDGYRILEEGREGLKEGGRKGGREGEKEGGREGGRERK